uniref:Uncharacterized protein n=1 Tax=Candidatus Kentrum sp. MB TaxID=2138164 RepID=A0A450Y227_9GAMM|nr:MAG: hypothetical protein BECKMB1821G_GA0114241_10448 [Candidatus Kentron sp. MB]VFK35590.1 MAG: hypothetical protein BECKMB1821I_GA0114274_11304 [Candidatus Kentron sp. MB]VFK77368.1 MAG: hypothetical protein BECKMB1821H_GA0114242_11294 [Candidatus Kentron sp. MB]
MFYYETADTLSLSEVMEALFMNVCLTHAISVVFFVPALYVETSESGFFLQIARKRAMLRLPPDLLLFFVVFDKGFWGYGQISRRFIFLMPSLISW